MGVKYVPTMLASDVAYGRRANQVSDRANIATGTFSSHPSVTTLGRYGGRAPLVLLGAGHFEELKDKPRPATASTPPCARTSRRGTTSTATSPSTSPPSSARQWELAIAVAEKKKNDKADKAKDEGRAILLADSDFVSDGWVGALRQPRCSCIDGMKWLIGDEAITGEINNENDVPIVHTKKQDQMWFYGSSFFAPALVLGIGFFVTRRRRPVKRARRARQRRSSHERAGSRGAELAWRRSASSSRTRRGSASRSARRAK